MSGNQFLLDQRAGWRASVLNKTNLVDGALQLQTVPGSGRPIVDAAGSLGGLQLPAGMAFDADGNLYILDRAAAVVKRYDPCQEAFSQLPCLGGQGSEPRQLNQPQGLAISPRGDLLVADTGNQRIQVFSLKGLVLRAIWLSPRTAQPQLPQAWQPSDIAVDCDCRAYIADYANGFIHVLDAAGRWLKSFDGISKDSPKLEKPTRIALDRHNHLYILQEGKDFVTILDQDGQYTGRVDKPDDVKGEFCPIGIGVDEDGTLFIGDRIARQVITYRTDACGRQTACRVRNVSADCQTVAFDRQGNPIIGDKGCVVQLVRDAAYEIEGSFTSSALDSDIYRCQWHRVKLGLNLASGTQVRVDTFTSDALKSDEEIDALDDARWATGILDSSVGDGIWDCLILSVPGRYLWLRLTLQGEGKTTPVIRSARIYYPRETSLQYLPAAYAEEPVARDFTERFLSIFDALNGRVDWLIAHMARLFDPGAVPSSRQADFLSWLASWMGLTRDQNWPEDRFRDLLRHAYQIYNLRGTPQGLKLHIRLFLGVEPAILEHFTLRRWLYLDRARLGDTSALYGESIVKRLQLDEYSRIGDFQLIDSSDPLHDPFYLYAHRFTVIVPVPTCMGDAAQRVVEQIIDSDRPAHTQADLKVIHPQFRVGVQALIGMDTVIGRYPERVATGEAKLGDGTVLGPSEDEAQPPALRIGKRSRIGSTTILN